MQEKNLNFMAAAIAFPVAIAFLILGSVFFLKFDPAAYDVKATGTIVAIDEYYESIGGENELMHTVYIDYSAGGKKYTHVVFPSYHFGMQVGDAVEFYYMSQDPTQLAGTDKDIAPYFGLAFAVIGFLMLIGLVLRLIRRKPQI